MLLSGITSVPTFQQAEDILIPMGEFFQIQVNIIFFKKFLPLKFILNLSQKILPHTETFFPTRFQ